MKIKPWKPYRFISCPGKNNPADVYVIVLSHFPSLRIHSMRESSHEGFYALKLIYLFIHSFIYLFIYNLRQEAWITHRASSTTISRKKKQTRKLVIQLTRMTILRNDKKRNANAKTELGRTSIKKQQHIRSSNLFYGRLVWHLIHTLLKV